MENKGNITVKGGRLVFGGNRSASIGRVVVRPEAKLAYEKGEHTIDVRGENDVRLFPTLAVNELKRFLNVLPVARRGSGSSGPSRTGRGAAGSRTGRG